MKASIAIPALFLSVAVTAVSAQNGAPPRVPGILEAEAIKPQAPGSIGQKVGGCYRSFNDEAAIERLGIQPIASELAAISRIASVRDLSVAFVRASQLGVRTPLSIGVAQDPQRSDVYAVIVTQAGLGMPDRDYYLRPDQQFAAVRTAYVEYISRLLTLAAQPDPAGAVQRNGHRRAG